MRVLIFGLGYTGAVIARELRGAGADVRATGGAGDVAFDAAEQALGWASHVISTVPPDEEADDPVLARYRDGLAGKWLGYLSSTGVYGDTGGAWVDESAPVGQGRRTARAQADSAWLGLGARVFRLPGIYGPGRSVFERIADGRARRIDPPGQVFSRIHVEDIAAGVVGALHAPPGAYNLADDLPASQNAVIERACALLGRAPPPLVGLEALPPAARAFYAENRRVANGKARRVLGWRPRYPTYVEGLAALFGRDSASSSPASASTDPPAASAVQR